MVAWSDELQYIERREGNEIEERCKTADEVVNYLEQKGSEIYVSPESFPNDTEVELVDYFVDEEE